MKNQKIAIIGGGPIGLEAALYGVASGYEVTLFEKNSVGHHIRQWGHVTLFSPWEMNHTPLGAKILQDTLPDWHKLSQKTMTGAEYVLRYLEPLSRLDILRDRIREKTEVVHLGKAGILKSDLVGNPKRGKHQFRLLTRNENGDEDIFFADIVIDASGVYSNPNSLGDGGIPALGESKNRDKIDFHLPDLSGLDRDRFARKHTLLIGSGYSAATTVCDFLKLIKAEPETKLTWMVRDNREKPIREIENDSLELRAMITKNANEAISHPKIDFLTGATAQSLNYNEPLDSFDVAVKVGDKPETITVDRIIANVGYGPDNSLYRELQVHECYATRGPMNLAAELLNSSSTDCLEQESPGTESLKNPEPDFYIIGNKSYGRNPTFLLKSGYRQIVEIFALITQNTDHDLYKKNKKKGHSGEL